MIMRVLGVFEWLIGVGAIFGGGALTIAPSGRLLYMPLSLLNGTPFRSYLIPGLLLLFVVGGSNIAAGWLGWHRRPSSGLSGVLAGAILTGWIAVQIELIGYVHLVQAVYFGCGLMVFVVAGALILTAPPERG